MVEYPFAEGLTVLGRERQIMRPPRELLVFLARYDPQVQRLALSLRRVVHNEIAPCHEYIFAMRSKVVLLYGATERVIDDGICHINVFIRHINLGFSRGAELDDPGHVLRGTGKAMRHITLKTLSDLEGPEIRAYLGKARRHAGLASQDTTAKVVTRVKSKAPTKQAPWPVTFV